MPNRARCLSRRILRARVLCPPRRRASRGVETEGRSRVWKILFRSVLSPRVVVPTVFGVGIIAVLLGYANAGQVLRAAAGFHPLYLLLILLCMLAYEALRAWQWHYFLRVLGQRESWRASVMSYMGG